MAATLRLRKHEAHGRGYFDAGAKRCQLSGFLVDREDEDVVAVLVRGQEEFARGVLGEVARGLAPGFGLACSRDHPGTLVDGEYRDAVVAAVGGVEELPRGMNLNVGRGVLPREVFRQRSGAAYGLEGSRFSIPLECGHSIAKLVDHVGPGFLWMKVEVTGAVAGFHRDEGRVVGCRLATFHFIDHELVDAEIGHDDKATTGVEVCRVGVGRCLAPGVDAGALVLKGADGGAECTVRRNRVDRATTRAIISDGGILSIRLYRHVAGAAAGGLAVHQAERATRFVYGKGGHAGAIFQLGAGIEHGLFRVHCKKRRVFRFHRESFESRLAGITIKVESIDALAVAAGVGAHIDPPGFRLGADCQSPQSAQQRQSRRFHDDSISSRAPLA